jgi:hypothetical protein
MVYMALSIGVGMLIGNVSVLNCSYRSSHLPDVLVSQPLCWYSSRGLGRRDLDPLQRPTWLPILAKEA